MNATNDYYRILQVQPDADKADIISSYRRLSKLYHPDISTMPQAGELMTQINIAYDTLCDDQKRQNYDKSLRRPSVHTAAWEEEAAQAVLTEYFEQLLQGRYDQAYRLLCASDKKNVDAQSFIQWRQAVQELYGIRDFTVRRGQHISGFKLERNRSVNAIKFFVDVLEKDLASGRLEHYCFNKYVVWEQGTHGVYLGYRDLNEIAKQFDTRARKLEKDLMQQHWQEHLSRCDRRTGLPTKEGLLAQSKRDLYRVQRYGEALTVAVLEVRPLRTLPAPLLQQSVEALAHTLQKTLRISDIPAYLGEGCFAILLFGLKKRHASIVVERIVKKAEHAFQRQSRGGTAAAYYYEIYLNGPLEPYLQRLKAKLDRK